MPIMDGLTAIRETRLRHALKVIPIIAISAESSPETQRDAIEAGANAYLLKPAKAAQITSMLQSFFEQ